MTFSNDKNQCVYIAGHNGLVGGAILRLLRSEGFSNIITRRSSELDLRDYGAVKNFFEMEKPAYVFLAAAKVGGIMANNTYPADFIYDNLTIQNNVIHQAYVNGVKKLLFLGSSCIYPKNAAQPIKEEYLLSGFLEPTNEPYAIAKIAGISMCQSYHRQYGANFISAMPTNLFGTGDNYDLYNSHVLPALIRKFHEAKISGQPSVTIWGTGTPRREFLHVDDAAAACYFLMENYNEPGIVNVGTGTDVSIAELAAIVQKITGYEGELLFDTSRPDGTMRKLLDVSKINALGWKAAKSMEEGIALTYKDFVENYEKYAVSILNA
ncbi:MAG: GDP-L-fucose synthase [Bacteroidota bacterium]|nr:GDP-L-fucose synthase [Bacteroidota bacterium]